MCKFDMFMLVFIILPVKMRKVESKYEQLLTSVNKDSYVLLQGLFCLRFFPLVIMSESPSNTVGMLNTCSVCSQWLQGGYQFLYDYHTHCIALQ